MTSKKTYFIIFLFLQFVLTGSTQTVIKDIFQGSIENNLAPTGYYRIDNMIYFQAQNEYGFELWKTDGTESGTTMVKDINPGEANSSVGFMTSLNGFLYFSAKDQSGESQLWKSDGTESGTVKITDSLTNVNSIAATNNEVFFSAYHPSTGTELWKTDGTEQGTVLVKNIAPLFTVGPLSSTPTDFFVFNNILYFSATDNIYGKELWRSDGTLSGTIMVKDINPGPNDSYTGYNRWEVCSNQLYLVCLDATHGMELWKTDGTTSGTQLIKDVNPGTANGMFPGFDIQTVGNTLYFTAQDASGKLVWKTDGTTSGTVKVKELWGGGPGGYVRYLAELNDTLYFSELTPNSLQSRIWKSDGTDPGTVIIRDSLQISDALFSLDDKLMFRADSVLSLNGALGPHGPYGFWTSDGTTQGTSYIKNMNAYPLANSTMVSYGDSMYFSTPNKVWKTNGTELGTVVVKNIYSIENASSPRDFLELGGIVYFTATDSIHGTELWKTNGTNPGTEMVKDIYYGSNSSFTVNFIHDMVEYNGQLFFVAEDSIHGRELWKSDGTEAGTEIVKNIVPDNIVRSVTNLTVFDGFLYFVADDGVDGYSVWKSDGTEAGTQLFSDPLAGPTPAIYQSSPGLLIDQLIVFDQALYFIARNTSNGLELWKSDGTQAGTGLFKDIRTGTSSSSPSMLTISDTLLFFIADNGSTGRELWKTDGTVLGTILVQDITPGTSDPTIKYLTDVNGTLYFVATQTSQGRVLWKSDGTQSGTIVVKDLYTNSSPITNEEPTNLINFNGVLFFSGNNGISGPELWKSDGTSAGTEQVLDINQGQNGSYPAEIAVIGSKILFSATNGNKGFEVYTSDGTTCHTLLFSDIFQGTISSNPKGFTQLGNEIIFAARTLQFGEELMKITLGSDSLTTQTFFLITCNAYTWLNSQVYDTTGFYIDTLQNVYGCDSLIVTLDLQVNSTSSVIDQVSCGPYNWLLNGITYSATGQYVDTIPNSLGCDSIVTLNLIILSDSIIDIQTACDSLTWIDGITYYSSTNIPNFVMQNAAGCDSTVTLNLTINHSTTGTDIQTACDSFTWPINGQTYTTSGQHIDTIPNAAGCDSIITLDLTIIPPLPLTIENSFSMPSDANTCTGEVAVTVSGNADFELYFDNGSQVITSNGYSLVTGLCAGVHDLHVTDNCGDTLSVPVVIPVDSNYVFNNPFIDSLAQDSLGVTMTNCDIYYAGIDTAYIDSIWATGNTVNVIWNIVDSNGSNFDTTSYVLNNGNGVYWLQLSVFCPNKSLGEYFTVTEAIYFNNGSVSTAGLADIETYLFEIYPNPTNYQVHISFPGSDAELTVYDIQGKVVLKDRIQNNGMVSLQNFERGVYLFDFRNSQGHSVQRVVKQ